MGDDRIQSRRRRWSTTLKLFLCIVAFVSLAKITALLSPDYKLDQAISQWLENSSSKVSSDVSLNQKINTLESQVLTDEVALLEYQKSLDQFLRGGDDVSSDPPELSPQLKLRYGSEGIERNWQLSSLLLQVAQEESNNIQKERLRRMARFLIGVIHGAESGQF